MQDVGYFKQWADFIVHYADYIIQCDEYNVHCAEDIVNFAYFIGLFTGYVMATLFAALFLNTLNYAGFIGHCAAFIVQYADNIVDGEPPLPPSPHFFFALHHLLHLLPLRHLLQLPFITP